MVVVAGVVSILAFRPDCTQVIRLIHVLIKYNVIAAMVNNFRVDSRTHPSKLVSCHSLRRMRGSVAIGSRRTVELLYYFVFVDFHDVMIM